MDHDTGVVLIFVIFFSLLIIGILWVFIKNRGRQHGDGYDLDDVLKRHNSWMHDLNEGSGNPANPASPHFYDRYRHRD